MFETVQHGAQDGAHKWRDKIEDGATLQIRFSRIFLDKDDSI